MGGKSDQVKGWAKEITGAVVGDKNLESQGTADRLVGEIREKLDDAKGNAKELVDHADDKGKATIDKIKRQ